VLINSKTISRDFTTKKKHNFPLLVIIISIPASPVGRRGEGGAGTENFENNSNKKVKVKQSRCRPGVAQRVPGS